MSDIQKESFAKVRKGPVGRAGVFVPEIQLVRHRKLESIEKRVISRPIEDVFVDIAFKIFPDNPQEDRDRWYVISRTLRHFEDLDPAILTVAAYLRLRFPLGLNASGFPVEGKLMPFDLSDNIVTGAIHSIIRLNEKPVGKLVPRIKADILAYYNMFFM